MSVNVTAAAIGLACALAIAPASAAVCPPTATVNGAARIVDPVRAILRAHDVSTDARACTGATTRVQASLAAESGARGYVLRIEDPFGRKSERRVGDAETAASLIESWLAPDTASLPAPPSTVTRAQIDDEPVKRAAEADPVGNFRLIGAFEVAASLDDSLWYGGAITACGAIGALCVGGRLRLMRDDALLDLDHDRGGRSALELLAVAGLPLAWKGVTLTPTLGFGLGRIHGDDPPIFDGESDMPGGDDVGLRLEAGASIGRPLNRHLTLLGELGASGAWSLSSRTSPAALLGQRMSAPTSYMHAAVALQYAP